MTVPVVLLDVNLQALKVIRSLGQKKIPIIGLVRRKGRWEHSSRYCDIRECEHGLGIGDSDYEKLKDYLITLAQELGSKPMLIPMQDDTVLFVSKFNDALQEHYRFLAPEPEILEKLVSKSGLEELADKCHIDQPKTHSLQTLAEAKSLISHIEYPALIKPVYSRSWLGEKAASVVTGKVVVINSDKELIREYERLAQLDNRLVLQEMIPGPDNNLFYYIGYFDEDSNPLASFVGVKERITPVHFGSASFVKSKHNKEVIDISTAFMNKIGYKGHVGIEYKYDSEKDSYKLIEVNARFGLWDGMAAKCGIDFAYLNYKYLLGEPISVNNSFEENVKWISFERDWSAFRQYRKEGGISLWQWIKSISTGRRDYAVFIWDDPLPFILSTMLFFKTLLVRMIKK
jgi:predicted ATP-grasp superfamily ATP-dependent carboligase